MLFSTQRQEWSPTGVPGAFALRAKRTELETDHIHLVPVVKVIANTR